MGNYDKNPSNIEEQHQDLISRIEADLQKIADEAGGVLPDGAWPAYAQEKGYALVSMEFAASVVAFARVVESNPEPEIGSLADGASAPVK